MSLQVWLPLNGDLHNQGLSGLTATNNGATVNNNGKIGKCYYFNGTSARISFPATTISYPISICAWIKGETITDSNTEYIFSYNTATGGTDGHNIGFGTYSGKLSIWHGGAVNQYGTALTNNVWYHVAAVVTSSGYKLYLNGQEVLSGTGTQNNKSSQFITLGARSNAAGGGSAGAAYYFKGYINDARVYNHALSPKEVEEIAKGLVLHYKLDDRFCEATTNLVTGLTSGGQTTVSNNIVTTSGTNADTYFTVNLSENIANGTQYTIQCYAEMPIGTTWTFPIGSQSNSSLSWILKPGYNEYTFTANDISWGTKRIFLDDLSGSARSSGVQCKFYNFQLEKKNHATGFAGYGATRSPTTIYDSSGYSHNGTITGSLTAAAGSPRYDVATYTASGNTDYIQTPTLNLPGDQITLNFWFKSSNKTPGSDYHMPLEAAANSNQAYEMSIYKTGYLRGGLVVAGTRKVDNCTSTKLTDGSWHMCTMTYDGTTIKRYVDAVMEKSTAATGSLVTSTYFILGHYGSSTSYYSKEAYTSDVRIYTTALTTDQVKELYNTSMSIDSNGNVYARELSEL